MPVQVVAERARVRAVVVHQDDVDVAAVDLVVAVEVLEQADAAGPRTLEELVLDEADEAVEAGVVLAQQVRERLQQVRPDALDRRR